MGTINYQNIADALRVYCERKGSQNAAARSLKGVSAATVSQVLNGEWALISDQMWRTIAAQIGYEKTEWAIVETRGFRSLTSLMEQAKENALVFAVTGEAGCGKSESIKTFCRKNRNVVHLCCSEYWNRKVFLQEMLTQLSIQPSGFTVGEMMDEIIREIKRRDSPLIVLDEADKLSDQVLYFFISIYNKLEGHCGIILCATDFLEKRIKKGARNSKKGYKEIYSRVGRKFFPVEQVNEEDIAAVCMANGITERDILERIIEDSDYDLRRVKRLVFAFKNR